MLPLDMSVEPLDMAVERNLDMLLVAVGVMLKPMPASQWDLGFFCWQ